MGLFFRRPRESRISILRGSRRITQERGNALFYILICIVLLGALTFAISQSPPDGSKAADDTAADEQITRMMSYAGTAGSAIAEMVMAGANPATLYTTLDLTLPAGGGFNTAPYTLKLYHPLGGGLTPQTSSGAVADSYTVGTSFKINKTSIVTDIGPTNVTVGDIMFTALVNSLANCQRINYMLWGNATVPAFTTANFNTLFTTGGTVTIAAGNCAACVGKAQMCVSNTANTAWGYYAVLLPG